MSTRHETPIGPVTPDSGTAQSVNSGNPYPTAFNSGTPSPTPTDGFQPDHPVDKYRHPLQHLLGPTRANGKPLVRRGGVVMPTIGLLLGTGATLTTGLLLDPALLDSIAETIGTVGRVALAFGLIGQLGRALVDQRSSS